MTNEWPYYRQEYDEEEYARYWIPIHTYFGLGAVIEYLESLDGTTTCKYKPVNPHSYRGFYSDLCLELLDIPGTVEDWLAVIKPCLGKTFQGYKGGDFVMNEHTDVWLGNEGSGGGQQIGKLLMDLFFDQPLQVAT